MENNENKNLFKNIARQTAYKVWIGDLLNGIFIKSRGEFEPSYAAIRGLNVSRVNLIGAVISSNSQEGYASIVVDDGSGSVNLRVWKEEISILNDISIGQLVLAVGKIKSFNNSIYVVPEFVRRIENADWFRHRKLELEKKFGKVVKIENSLSSIPVVDDYIPGQDIENEDMNYISVQEEKVSESSDLGSTRGVITSLIENEDKGEGADIALIIAKSGIEENIAQKIIEDLIKGGEVFEVRAGFVRVLG